MRSAWVVLALLLACASRPSAAQSNTVTATDIQRLHDVIDDASSVLARLGTRDVQLAADLQRELDDARDETIYLKVKLRKNESISPRELTDLRASVESIRERALKSQAR